MVRVDDIDTILLANNITTMSHTKHFDIRYKYANKYMENKVVNIIIVKSAENDSNILTTKVSTELHEKHSKKC